MQNDIDNLNINNDEDMNLQTQADALAQALVQQQAAVQHLLI